VATTRKKEQVKELQGLFNQSQVLIFTDYRGLTVAELTDLRRQLRDKGVEYHITKNTLTSLAGNRSGMSNLDQLIDGPTAIAFVGNDIPGAAKVLTDFARVSKIMQIRGALVGQTVLNTDQVSDLTKILPREQYIAKVMGSLNSPISGMVNTLAGVLRGFMNVMQARVDQLKEQGDGAGPEAETAEVPTTAPAASTNGASDTETAVSAPTASLAPEAGAGDAPGATLTPEASAEPAPETSSEDAAASEPAAEEAAPETSPEEATEDATGAADASTDGADAETPGE